ncbi:arylsulfatase [Flexithrix dorotheae]|uniref:arylsulfatase n=1 Tax=Flexithrix dorotheae TaxID=70993 RepID=UPI00037270AE|nr:arylsulfatase [Flexithrix dorotheae]
MKKAGLLLIGLGLFLSLKSFCQKASKPNIILILADDMGYSDIGCFGSEVQTPNLDKLAASGVKFSQFYNNARCCPSRAALLTGLYPHQAGIGGMTDTHIPIPEYQGFFKDNTITLANALQSAGYSTFMSGKWHVGEENGHWPKDYGFEESFAFINGASSYFDFKPYRNENWPPGNKLKVVHNATEIDFGDSTIYTTDLYTDNALQQIKNHKKDKPFFLYLAYTAPHWPMHALPEDIAKYKGKYNEGWEAIRERRFEKLKKLGLIKPTNQLSEKFPVNRDWESLSETGRNYEAKLMEVYAAMVDRLDQNIGRLLQTLETSSQLDNTLILFLSDNGGCSAGNLAIGKYAHPRFEADAEPGSPKSFTGYGKNWANVSNTPFRQFKSNIHEGGIAAPFIAFYPKKFQEGEIIHEPTHIVDIMPTLLEIGNAKYPKNYKGKTLQPYEGSSLVDLMKGEKKDLNRTLFFEHLGNAGLIEGKWKLVKNHNQPWELYNLEDDRSETNDLAEESAVMLQKLINKYEKWAAKNNVLSKEEVNKAIPFKF